MSYRFDPGSYNNNPMSRMKGASVVKTLIIINAAIYVIELIARVAHRFDWMIDKFGMVPSTITHHLYVWQFLTAMFLHGNFFHIVFNMLGLFFFGPELEWLWGKARFLLVYLLIGVASNVFAYLLDMHSVNPIIGASGAVFAVLGAYAALYPNRQLIFFLFPVKAKYLVLFYFIFSLLGATNLEGNGGTAYAVHVAGIALGVLYVKLRWERVADFVLGLGSRAKLGYLRHKYRHLKVMDPEDEPRWDRYKN